MSQAIATKVLDLGFSSGKSRTFLYRDVEADRGVIKQIFIRHDYLLSSLTRRDDLLRRYSQIITDKRIPLIIDAGANIGASAVFFTNDFPDAEVVAFEPDRGNFELLERNTYGLRVDLRNSAIGSENSKVLIQNPGASPWAFIVEKCDSGTIDLVSITDVIKEKKSEGREPFIVKIDIEGGEDNLFERDVEWIHDVPLIIIELHDWLFPKKGTSKNFLKAIGGANRDFVHRGENIFSIKNDM